MVILIMEELVNNSDNNNDDLQTEWHREKKVGLNKKLFW